MRQSLDIYYAYSILELTPGASQDEIKQAYRQLVKIWHPDRFVLESQKQEAEEKIKLINAAYERLKSVETGNIEPSKGSETPPTQKEHQQPPGSTTNQAKNQQSNQNPQPFRTKIYAKPTNPQIFYDLGVEHAKNGEYEEAIAAFTRAIRINPDYIEAYRYRGFACSMLGYENRATSDFNQVAQLEREQKRDFKKKTKNHYSKPSNKASIPRNWGKRLCQILKSVLMLNQK